MVRGQSGRRLRIARQHPYVHERDRIALARKQSRLRAAFSAPGRQGPAVVVLAQWNARWEEQQNICRWLNRLGITAVKMSLPYHDRRAIPGHPRGDHLVGPNIGLTLQANRQAVVDARRTLLWLARQGYTVSGSWAPVSGSSIGVRHDVPRAGASRGRISPRRDLFWGCGRQRPHHDERVGRSLRPKVSRKSCRRYWSPISPFPYIPKLNGTRGKKFSRSAGATIRHSGLSSRTHFCAKIHRDGLQARSAIPSVRALLAGRRAVQICRRFSLRNFSLSGALVKVNQENRGPVLSEGVG